MKTMDILQSFLLSMVLVFILFCIFWAAIFSGYIQYYGIEEFFNPFFSNVFNPVIFFLLSAIFGIGFAIPFLDRIFKILFFLLFICSLCLFIPFLGRLAGEIFLARTHILHISNTQKEVNGLYENAKYIVYLSAESDDFKTRQRNLIYYQKPKTE